jgi:hypothetical protein
MQSGTGFCFFAKAQARLRPSEKTKDRRPRSYFLPSIFCDQISYDLNLFVNLYSSLKKIV